MQIRGILRSRGSLFDWGDIDGRDFEEHPPVEQSGDAIRVGHSGGGWAGWRMNLLFDIVVPPSVTLEAQADAGDIHVTGVKGVVVCRTSAGHIEISDAGNGVRASADAGRIRITRVNGPAYAKTDAGEIHALEIAGAIDAQTDSGEIRLSQTIAAPVRARTDSGRILVKLAAGGYMLRVRTDSGTIRVPEMAISERSANEVTGTIRGGGPLVELSVDSGSIEVE